MNSISTHWWGNRIRHACSALQTLVWSVQCAGCNEWDKPLCDRCSSLATAPPLDLVLDDAQGVPSWQLLATGRYEGALRNVLLAAKHDPVRDLSDFLYQAGYSLGASLGRRLAVSREQQIWVVPTPSSRKRKRERAEIVPFIAEGFASGLQNTLALRTDTLIGQKPCVRMVNAVQLQTLWNPMRLRTFREGLGRRLLTSKSSMNRHRGSQQGRGLRERGLARAGTMELTCSLPKNVQVVVVDDVCASGATLREVLRHVGHQTLVIAVVAVSGGTQLGNQYPEDSCSST